MPLSDFHRPFNFDGIPDYTDYSLSEEEDLYIQGLVNDDDQDWNLRGDNASTETT